VKALQDLAIRFKVNKTAIMMGTPRAGQLRQLLERGARLDMVVSELGELGGRRCRLDGAAQA
jgi:hypothetical protein